MSIASEIARLNTAKSSLAGKMKTAGYSVTGGETLSALVSALDLTKGGETMPIGSVIYYAGKSAPSGYLACDGTVYNISAYPDLANFMQSNYGSKNYWGGNGSTTFAVPDWQGEFFRAAGTQSRANQGSGAGVGVHQDGTLHIGTFDYKSGNSEHISGVTFYARQSTDSNTLASAKGKDWYGELPYEIDTITVEYNSAQNVLPEAGPYTSRPTNTSLLVCIKAT